MLIDENDDDNDAMEFEELDFTQKYMEEENKRHNIVHESPNASEQGFVYKIDKNQDNDWDW